MIITGTGGTDFYPSNSSPAETLIVVVVVLIGALLWTQILARFCELATNSDPSNERQHVSSPLAPSLAHL